MNQDKGMVWHARPEWWSFGEREWRTGASGFSLYPLYTQGLGRSTDGRFVCSGGREAVWLARDGQCACGRALVAGAPCDHMLWLRRGLEGYIPDGFLWEHETRWQAEPVAGDWQIGLETAVESLTSEIYREPVLVSWVVSHPFLDAQMIRNLVKSYWTDVLGALLRRKSIVEDQEVRSLLKEGIEKGIVTNIWTREQLLGGTPEWEIPNEIDWIMSVKDMPAFRILALLEAMTQGRNIRVSKDCFKKFISHPERDMRAWGLTNLSIES